MHRFQSFLIILLIATACGEKKEVVNKDNLRDVLTRYGETHPEMKSSSRLRTAS
ncbi:MAG: hypothetical protein WDO15_19755 [Bacteroidota bacterium]